MTRSDDSELFAIHAPSVRAGRAGTEVIPNVLDSPGHQSPTIMGLTEKPVIYQ